MSVLPTPSQSVIAELRRMAVVSADQYLDETLIGYIQRYASVDERGQRPYRYTATVPPVQELNLSWIPTWDLHAAAADIWGEKAAALSSKFDFQTEDERFQVNQQFQNAQKMQRYHQARRRPISATVYGAAYNDGTVTPEWIGNAPEVEENP